MPDAPRTAEGWYMLHDFRTIDWDAWRDAPERTRTAAVDDGVDYLESHEAVEDAPTGDSATFAVLGHEADLLVVHLRPTLEDLDRAQRRFERTGFAEFAERADSYVSVTEVSGYVSREYFEDGDVEDEGLRRYIEGKLEPDLPDDGYVSFYPMAKRRDAEYNWYDLDFEERADLMADHGDVGREFAGRIRQVIASSVGFDDWEWGVTLFGDDPTDIKDVVYEMRFDEASSRYGEFGGFYVGRRFPPADLDAYMAGQRVPVDGEDDSRRPHGDAPTADDSHHSNGHTADEETEPSNDGRDVREALAELNVYGGRPHGEDVFATVIYSEAGGDDLLGAVNDLRESFDHYDTHVKTAVYDAADADRRAVVSVWETDSAAETAAGFLADLPGAIEREDGDGFGTMGMFYTVEPDRRAAFVEKFDAVGGLLDGMDGHRGTDLMVNREDENDMFIASRWDEKEDAMAFFRSEEFRDTVQWGRDVLADRPRHVFLS